MPDNQPITPIPTQAPQQGGLSPAAIQELRRYAAALAAQKTPRQPFYSWANGLDDATAKIMGAVYSKQADEAERAAGRQSGAAALGLDDATSTPSPAGGGFPGGVGGAIKGLFGLNGTATGGAAPTSPFTPASSQADGTGAEGATTPDLTAFIKQREGFRSTPYPDGKQTSIGYGTRAQPGETSITRDEAENRLN